VKYPVQGSFKRGFGERVKMTQNKEFKELKYVLYISSSLFDRLVDNSFLTPYDLAAMVPVQRWCR